MIDGPDISGREILSLGIVTAGGNAPGYNSFIKGALRFAEKHNAESPENTPIIRMYGLRYGLRSLLERQSNLENLTNLPSITVDSRFSGAGSQLGCSRGFIDTAENDPTTMRTIMENVEYYRSVYGMKGLIVGGGDGSMMGLRNVLDAGGFPFNQVPVSIDNDIVETETTVGFNSATDRLDLLVEEQLADVSSHQRIMVMQVMGRDCGLVAFKGGRKADMILIGECPVSNKKIIERANELYKRKNYAVIVVGENFDPEGYENGSAINDPSGNKSKGNRAEYLAKVIQEGMDDEARAMAQEPVFVRSLDTGNILRSTKPNPKDSRLARRMGADAVFMALSDKWNYMITRKGEGQMPVPISQIHGGKQVNPAEYDFDVLQKDPVSLGVRQFISQS